MLNRKITLGLIFSILFIFLFLLVPDSKAAGQDCCANSDCPGGGYFTCTPGSNYCNGNYVENLQVCVRETCDGAACGSGAGSYFGVCQQHSNSSYVSHSDLCAYGCSNGACNLPPTNNCSNPYGANGSWMPYDCSPATAGGCASNACVGYPMFCDNGTWVNRNPAGECTTSCNNCSHGGGTPYCGDNICNNGENCSTCPGDCGNCVGGYCGDGSCNNGENCSTCPGDCGSCPPGGVTCNTDVNLSVTPNPGNTGQSMTFRVTSGDASTYPGDIWSGGVSGCGGAWNNQTCTAQNAGNYTYTKTWRHCVGSFSNCSGQCSKSINFTVNTPTTTLAGFVRDTNNIGIPNVTINQGTTNPPGCNIGTATSDSNGYFHYDGIAVGKGFCMRPPISGVPNYSYVSGDYECQIAGRYANPDGCGLSLDLAVDNQYNFTYAACPAYQADLACTATPAIRHNGDCTDRTQAANAPAYQADLACTATPAIRHNGDCTDRTQNTNCFTRIGCSGNTCVVDPWLQTSGGDVHSNTGINAPGGP